MSEKSPGQEPGVLVTLSDELKRHLRSGVAISSFTQCIEELVSKIFKMSFQNLFLFLKDVLTDTCKKILTHTPIPILELHALHKQYTDYPTLASKYEVGSLYKNVLFIRNIQ